jgi:hydrogenase maturation factor
MTTPDNSTTVEHCAGEICVTCSDQAVPGRVRRLLPDLMAEVDFGDTLAEVSVALVTAAAGDTVLVHAGEAIAVVEPRGGT